MKSIGKAFLERGCQDSQLRFFTSEGKLVPTPEEVAEKMTQKLQYLGIDWRDLA